MYQLIYVQKELIMQTKLQNVEVINVSSMTEPQAANTLAKFDSSKVNLYELGLKESDLPDIESLSKEFSQVNNLSVAEYGKDISSKTNECTQQLLTLVQNRDLDETGTKLNQVLTVAQGINGSNLIANNSKLSRLPLIGGLFKSAKKARNNFAMKFNNTNDQINSLVNEIEVNQNGLKQRVNLLDNMFDNVNDEYRSLGIHIAAGRIKLGEIQNQLSLLTNSNSADDKSKTQEIYDLNHLANNLEKRLSDLFALQQSAMQTLPMIRIIQSNNLMLVDKFYAIKNITIPSWRNQISLAISLEEQKNSVELANIIDDTTNDLLRRNSELLHSNSVQTAKANQRQVIDYTTLEFVQNNLIKTVNDVIAIQQQGVKERVIAEQKIKQLQVTYNQSILKDSHRITNG